jgi:prepilin-type processing-associated H-X9-DG protein
MLTISQQRRHANERLIGGTTKRNIAFADGPLPLFVAAWKAPSIAT